MDSFLNQLFLTVKSYSRAVKTGKTFIQLEHENLQNGCITDLNSVSFSQK
jgi:hypothetical protein